MAQHPSPADEQAGAGLPFPTIRNVGLGAPFRWIARGFSDLKACPTASLFYGFCFTGMGLLVTFVFEHAYQYTSAVTTGFLLLAPFFAMGLYELSRRRELGEACALLPTLTVWRRNAGNIAVFAAVLTVIFLIWALTWSCTPPPSTWAATAWPSAAFWWMVAALTGKAPAETFRL